MPASRDRSMVWGNIELDDKLSDADMDGGQTSDDEDPKKHANNSSASSIKNSQILSMRVARIRQEQRLPHKSRQSQSVAPPRGRLREKQDNQFGHQPIQSSQHQPSNHVKMTFLLKAVEATITETDGKRVVVRRR